MAEAEAIKTQGKPNSSNPPQNMMRSQNLPFLYNSTVDQFQSYGLHFDSCEFSSSFTTMEMEDSSEISSIPHFSTMFSNDIFPYPACDDQLQDQVTVSFDFDDFSVPLELEGLDSILTDRIEDLYNCLDGRTQDVWSPTEGEASTDMSSNSMQSSSLTNMPGIESGEAMEIDNQLSLFHLLKAYGEAAENNQTELAEVILRCVSEKGNPVGGIWERIAFNLTRNIRGNQSDYLVQECSNNFETAFRAFYEIFPYGRFAHFSANSAILEAMPNDADMRQLHIVDFDIGEGIQWPPLIEAMEATCSHHKSLNLRLTSIRWGEEEALAGSPWKFEDTRRKLSAHARSFGIKLKVEEMGIEDLVNELKEMKKRGDTKKWLAFNCMVGLPHMGKLGRSMKLANEFLNVANEVLSRNRGIITFGDGDCCEKMTDKSGFGTFFDGKLMHYQAVLESMESNFARHLTQARMAMEQLFAGPNMCVDALVQKWKEMSETCYFQTFQGLKVSRDRLMEAKEIVREGENSYEVSIEGNNLALLWRGITLLRVSCWTN